MVPYSVGYFILSLLGIQRNPSLDAPKVYNPRCSMTINNATVYCQANTSGEKSCTVLCNNKLKTYRCSENRGWEQVLPDCVSDLKDYSQWCSLTVDKGLVNCNLLENDVLKCNVMCKFPQTEYRFCRRHQGWDKELPSCVSGLKEKSRCNLNLRNGSAVCDDGSRGQVSCTVSCNGKRQGFYSCSQKEGWNKQLPHCVSELHEYSRCSLTVMNGAVVCGNPSLDTIECNVMCGVKDEGYYRCSKYTGWDKKLPHCVSHLKGPE